MGTNIHRMGFPRAPSVYPVSPVVNPCLNPRQCSLMQKVDTLIHAAHVLPVQPRATLADHAVAITAGKIVAVLPSSEARARYQATEVVDLPHHVLMPGLVNLHCHAAMSLLRGIADDL